MDVRTRTAYHDGMRELRHTHVTDPLTAELLDEYFAERAAGFTGGSYSVARPDPERFVAPNGAFLLVCVDGEALGCGGIRRLSEDTFEVKHLYLRPSARGQHLGSLLLAELERVAREYGATTLVLDTNTDLEAAGGLYRSAGFEETEPYNDNPNATTWFRKQLS